MYCIVTTYLVPFLRYSTSNNSVPLKCGFGVIQSFERRKLTERWRHCHRTVFWRLFRVDSTRFLRHARYTDGGRRAAEGHQWRLARDERAVISLLGLSEQDPSRSESRLWTILAELLPCCSQWWSSPASAANQLHQQLIRAGLNTLLLVLELLTQLQHGVK